MLHCMLHPRTAENEKCTRLSFKKSQKGGRADQMRPFWWNSGQTVRPPLLHDALLRIHVVTYVYMHTQLVRLFNCETGLFDYVEKGRPNVLS